MKTEFEDALARIAEAFGCVPSDAEDLVEAAKLLVAERDAALAMPKDEACKSCKECCSDCEKLCEREACRCEECKANDPALNARLLRVAEAVREACAVSVDFSPTVGVKNAAGVVRAIDLAAIVEGVK